MAHHKVKRSKQGAPQTAEEAAERFKSMTGFDLASDPDFTGIHQHLVTWRVALAAAEYEPIVEAIVVANGAIRSRAVRAIPTCQPIPLAVPPAPEVAGADAMVSELKLAFQMVAAGCDSLARCIEQAKATGLTPKVRIGRPENELHRALCLLLVEKMERAGRPRLTNHQVALVAHAYGVAAPAGSWDDWLERWRRLMNDARAEQPGTKTPRQRLLLKAARANEPASNPALSDPRKKS